MACYVDLEYLTDNYIAGKLLPCISAFGRNVDHLLVDDLVPSMASWLVSKHYIMIDHALRQKMETVDPGESYRGLLLPMIYTLMV